MYNAPIFMHSKQGKKTTVPHHLHTLQHKLHPSLTKKPKITQFTNR